MSAVNDSSTGPGKGPPGLTATLGQKEGLVGLLSRAEEVAHFGSWEREHPGGKGHWSAGMYRIFGLPCNQGSPRFQEFLALIHPDDRERVAKAYRELVTEGGTCEHDYRIIRPDGAVRVLYAHVAASRGAAGDVVLTGVNHDLTECARAQRELLEREESYRNVIQHANEGIGILQDGIVRFANEYMARMLGYSPEETRGTSLEAYVHPCAVEELR